MDYLNRDSYFTGVSEGVIGYDRIIKMLNVVAGKLVVEEKGIYSVERFLTSRRIMYWQVYLHKTVLSAEQMLVRVLQRARELHSQGRDVWAPPSLHYFLHNSITATAFSENPAEQLHRFAQLDDTDIASAVKSWQEHPDPILSYLSYGLISRKLFRLEFSSEPFTDAYCKAIEKQLMNQSKYPIGNLPYFLIRGSESNSAYTLSSKEIMVLTKKGKVVPMSQVSDFGIEPRTFKKYYLSYPKSVTTT